MLQDLASKIGQLFLVGFAGDRLGPNHPLRADIAEGNLGGVILFDRFVAGRNDRHNIVDAAQIRELTAALQDLAGGRLLIAVDQEGGRVSRFPARRGFPETPPAATLGDAGIEATAQAARQTAKMLSQAGVNFNLAPVVDLDLNPDNPIIGRYGRSFSKAAATVVSHAQAWIGAHRELRIASCLKHFPGHGSSGEDSHLGLVDISNSWSEAELEPYRLLIDGGFAEAIMVGHLKNTTLDRHCPTSLSAKTLEFLLRRQLHFEGLLLSDDMQMRAITDIYGLEEACCRALAAGIDMLIIGNNLHHDPQVFRSLCHSLAAATTSGDLAEERIEQACQRVQTFKRTILSHHVQF